MRGTGVRVRESSGLGIQILLHAERALHWCATRCYGKNQSRCGVLSFERGRRTLLVSAAKTQWLRDTETLLFANKLDRAGE